MATNPTNPTNPNKLSLVDQFAQWGLTAVYHTNTVPTHLDRRARANLRAPQAAGTTTPVFTPATAGSSTSTPSHTPAPIAAASAAQPFDFSQFLQTTQPTSATPAPTPNPVAATQATEPTPTQINFADQLLARLAEPAAVSMPAGLTQPELQQLAEKLKERLLPVVYEWSLPEGTTTIGLFAHATLNPSLSAFASHLNAIGLSSRNTHFFDTSSPVVKKLFFQVWRPFHQYKTQDNKTEKIDTTAYLKHLLEVIETKYPKYIKELAEDLNIVQMPDLSDLLAPPFASYANALQINLGKKGGFEKFKTWIEGFQQSIDTANDQEISTVLNSLISELQGSDVENKKKALFLLRLCSTGIEIYSKYSQKDMLKNETVQRSHSRLWYELAARKLVACTSLANIDGEPNVLNAMDLTNSNGDWPKYSQSLRGITSTNNGTTFSTQHIARITAC